MNKLSQRSKDNLKGIHPNLAKVINEAIKDCPIDFTIVCGIRTATEQQALYAQGRTIPGKIVTNCDGIKLKSNHQVKGDGYGYAVDLYPYHSGSVQINDVAGLTRIAQHIRSIAKSRGISIEWGGDWKMKDYPHFELK